MIEINLLPEELKIKKLVNTQLNFIVFAISTLALIILLIINIFVISLSAAKNIQLKILNKKWEGLFSQRQKVKEFKEGSSILTDDVKAIQQLTKDKILWSAKINKLSSLLPSGIWFRDIALDSENLIIRGTIVSLEKEEMNKVNLFLNNLRKDELFYSDFDNLDLTSVQRRILGGYEVVDFIIAGKLKTK